MRIGIDFDDVIINFAGAFLEFHNKNYCTNLKYADLTDYYFSDVFDIDTQTAIDRVMEFFKSEDIKCVNHIDGVEDVLVELKSNGHELIIVTSRPDCFKDVTVNWINENLEGGIDMFSDVHHIVSCEKELSKDNVFRTKAEFIKKNPVDIFIDDRYSHLVDIGKLGVKTILFSRIWNEKDTLLPNMYRANSWGEVVERINED